jgi:hypothetical protein
MMQNGPRDHSYTDQNARMDFDRAHLKSFYRDILSWFNHSSNDLLPYDEVRRVVPLKGQLDVGIKVVPLDHIVGSVNRYNDFDRAFLPKETNTRGRWMSIDKARMQEVNLPAIEVIKIGEVYFVKDGNHRVSVAREMGQLYIDAYVSEIITPVEITPDQNLEEIILKQEYNQFLANTQIDTVVPDHQIRLTQVGVYSQLEEHISVHRWYMGEKFDQPITEEEAVRSWYYKVYLPIVQIVRNQRILDDFPGYTETDLYSWIITHQYYMAESKQGYVPFEQAALHFVNKYSHKPIRRFKYQLKKVWKKVKKVFQPKTN